MHKAFRNELGVFVHNEGIYKNKYQIISEIWPPGKGMDRVYCAYKGQRVLMNRAPPDEPRLIRTTLTNPNVINTTTITKTAPISISKLTTLFRR